MHATPLSSYYGNNPIGRQISIDEIFTDTTHNSALPSYCRQGHEDRIDNAVRCKVRIFA